MYAFYALLFQAATYELLLKHIYTYVCTHIHMKILSIYQANHNNCCT